MVSAERMTGLELAEKLLNTDPGLILQDACVALST